MMTASSLVLCRKELVEGPPDLQGEEQAGCQQTAVWCPVSRDVGAQLMWLQATLIILSLSLAPRSTAWLWSESQLHCDPVNSVVQSFSCV